MSERVWRFGDHGCCGDGGLTGKGEPKPCGCRNLVIDSSPITFDRKEGPLPRIWDAHCPKCSQLYTVYPHTNRVEVRKSP